VSIRAGVSKIGPPGAGSPTEQDITAASFRVHPGYSNTGPEIPGDIAVLTLSQPLDLSGPSVQAASLPPANTPYPLKAALSLAGYGQETPAAPPTEQLNSMTSTVEPQGYCGQLSEFRRIMYFDNGSEFCAVSPTSSVCGGDSGSGLVTTGAPPVLMGVICSDRQRGPFDPHVQGDLGDINAGDNRPAGAACSEARCVHHIRRRTPGPAGTVGHIQGLRQTPDLRPGARRDLPLNSRGIWSPWSLPVQTHIQGGAYRPLGAVRVPVTGTAGHSIATTVALLQIRST